VGAAGVKYGDTGGGTTEASWMPGCTGMVECTEMFECTGMVEPTGIVEDCAVMAESSWMSSEMGEAIGIPGAVEMDEAIITARACWVVGDIWLVEASGILVGMSIPSTKNNWNIGETLLSSKSFNHQTISHFLHAMFQLQKNRKNVSTILFENSHTLSHST
jgi:hypothetical protein